MTGSGVTPISLLGDATISQLSRTQVDVFSELYLVYLVLGTIVGVVVIAYMLHSAYKYRSTAPDAEGRYDIEEEYDDDDVVRPRLGELPTGGKGGKKLFLSFGISAVLVLGLIIYAYSLLLYIENPDPEEEMEIEVEGFQFGWAYEYENGYSTSNELIVPADEVVSLEITSRDVMHNYGIPGLRAKADAMPGQTTDTWFQAEETGEYKAICYELCGNGHSNMREDVLVLPPEEFEWSDDPDEFEEWYDDTRDAWQSGELDHLMEVTN